MKLRTKTLLVIGITLLGLNGVLYAVSSSILRNSVSRSEEHSLRDSVNGVRYVLDQEIASFSDNSLQWSNWDDTYNFIVNPQPAYIESNLVPATFGFIKLNLFVLLNNQNEVIYSRAFDLKKQQELPIPESINKHLNASDSLIQSTRKSKSLSGLLILPQGAMIVTSQPILPSLGQGEVRGTLIWGRYLSQELTEKLSRTSRSVVTLHRIQETSLPPDVQQAKAFLAKTGQIYIHRLSEEHIAGYTVISDIYNQPALILRVEDRRDIYLLGTRRQRYLMISLLVLGLGFSGISLLTLERLVLSRLAGLSQKVQWIGQKGDLSLRLHLAGNDELSGLAQNINGMLGAIEQQAQERQESEERLRKQQSALLELAQSQAIYTGDLAQAWSEITETASRTLQVERVSVWLYHQVAIASSRAQNWRSQTDLNDPLLVCQDLYQSSLGEHSQGLVLNLEQFPAYFQALERDRVLVAPDVQTDPRIQEFSEAYTTPFGISSLLDTPIQAAGQVVGVLCVEAVGNVRQWSLEEQNFVTYLGYMAALAIESSDRLQAEAKFRNIFENAVEGIFQSTPEGQYLSANPALARIYGYESPEELMHELTDISQQLYVNPQRRQEFREALQQNGAVTDFQSQVYRRDRKIIWISEAARAVRNAQGEVLYYEGTVEDITHRKVAEEALRYQQEQAERLLLNILPEPIALRLKREEQTIADSFPAVSVLFADIVGFTQLSTTVSPIELVSLLNRIFSAFDRLAERHQLEKIKTIGDAYMVVSGLPMPRVDHAEAIADMALDMQREIEKFSRQIGTDFSMRIGINTGPVVAGVIGIKKFIYDLWGDTVNTASRMESHGIPGQIQVTAAIYDCLKDHYDFEPRGAIYIKGKGDMQTYLLKGKKVKISP